MPRDKHLYQELHVFKYLKDHKHSKCVFGPNYVDIIDDHMPDKEQEIYQKIMNKWYFEAVEDLPLIALDPKGPAVQIYCYVDTDHGGD